MQIDLERMFIRYGWVAEQADTGIWLSVFTIENEEEFDLFVMASEEWIHFAVSPFLPKIPAESRHIVLETVLRLNQQMRLVYFAIDDDGDINLLAELPRPGFSFRQFKLTVDRLALYTERLAPELARLAREPDYRSPLLPDHGLHK